MAYIEYQVLTLNPLNITQKEDNFETQILIGKAYLFSLIKSKDLLDNFTIIGSSYIEPEEHNTSASIEETFEGIS